MSRVARCLACALLLLTSACASGRAYVDYRPGLSAADFDARFELSVADYEDYADRAIANTMLDRYRGEARPEAASAMQAVGAGLRPDAIDRGDYGIVDLGAEGTVTLRFGRIGTLAVPVDWFATTEDRSWAAVRSGDKLAVSVAGASTGIDLGSLLGESPGLFRMLMLIEGDELTVFALPELAGAVTADESGFVFSFRHTPGARRSWAISVAKVAVSL